MMSIVEDGSTLALHRPVDSIGICRELHDHAVSTTLVPGDPVLSMQTPCGSRQVLTYAVM